MSADSKGISFPLPTVYGVPDILALSSILSLAIPAMLDWLQMLLLKCNWVSSSLLALLDCVSWTSYSSAELNISFLSSFDISLTASIFLICSSYIVITNIDQINYN
jgi:hypothetical protein